MDPTPRAKCLFTPRVNAPYLYLQITENGIDLAPPAQHPPIVIKTENFQDWGDQDHPIEVDDSPRSLICYGHHAESPGLDDNPNWLTKQITQMMFVSGETVEPSPDTTTLVEQIVQQQVQEMVC